MTKEWAIVTIITIICFTAVTIVFMFIKHDEKFNQKGQKHGT